MKLTVTVHGTGKATADTVPRRERLTTELRQLADALTHRAKRERNSPDGLQLLLLDAHAVGVDLTVEVKPCTA